MTALGPKSGVETNMSPLYAAKLSISTDVGLINVVLGDGICRYWLPATLDTLVEGMVSLDPLAQKCNTEATLPDISHTATHSPPKVALYSVVLAS